MSRLEFLKHKIQPLEEAVRTAEMWRMKGNKLVFTNGCFDILHKGHVTYLAQAAQMGTKLIVGLNTDASVRAQEKGDDRPYNDESARAFVLAALGFVDLIILFEDNTPIKLLEALNPHVLVKGADYDPEERDQSSKKYIVGSDYVRKIGGEVKVVELVEGFSTTAIANKMKS